jgi:hypothetical protein
MICPRGTYMDKTHNQGLYIFKNKNFFCDLCPSGYVCDQEGMEQLPEKLCPSGYFCKLAAPMPFPSCDDTICTDLFGICPPGSFCPLGSSVPQKCPVGTYMNESGSSECDLCQPGIIIAF